MWTISSSLPTTNNYIKAVTITFAMALSISQAGSTNDGPVTVELKVLYLTRDRIKHSWTDKIDRKKKKIKVIKQRNKAKEIEEDRSTKQKSWKDFVNVCIRS